MGFRLRPGQSIARETVRIAEHQLELASAGLIAGGDVESDAAIHEARRHIKKIRALMRLVRRALKGHRYRAVNQRLRTVSRLLAPIADGQATVETLSRVAERSGGELSPDAVAEIHARLVHRESVAYEEAAVNDVFETAAALLRAERDAVNRWELREGGFRAIAAGLEHTARASRRAMATAVASARSGDYHTWRQRVKDHWLQVRLLQERCGDALALDERRLEALDGYLGECHNCAILRDVLTSDSTLDRGDVERCLGLVRRYERDLRGGARKLGARIYRETPRQFVNRVRRLWRSTRQASRTRHRGTSWPSAA